MVWAEDVPENIPNGVEGGNGQFPNDFNGGNGQRPEDFDGENGQFPGGGMRPGDFNSDDLPDDFDTNNR